MLLSTAKNLFIMDRRSRGLAPKTISDYEHSIDRFIRETGVQSLEDCTRQIIINWINSFDLKPVSANKYIRDIRAFLYFFMEEGDIPTFRIHTIKMQETPPKFYTDEELEKLLAPSKSGTFVEYRTWVMIAIALGTGARIQTICSLQVDDIDWNTGMLTYRHTKNKNAAAVPISGKLLGILRRYIALYNLDRGSLCPDVYGQALTVHGAEQALQDFCAARGVLRHSWHSFRHSFARTWILQGGDIVRLQHMLQHSDISQTAHYARIFGADLSDTARFTALEQITIRQRKYH